MTPSPAFKNLVLDCLEDVICATTGELSDMLWEKLDRRPHVESIRKTLVVLAGEGLVNIRHRGNGQRGYRNAYSIARTKPIKGSLRKAA